MGAVKLGIVMDPISSIKPVKDSSFAMLLAAQKRGWSLHYMEQADIYLLGDTPHARMRELAVFDDTGRWFELGATHDAPLAELDVILMRKDPPMDMEYVYTTQMLELAERQGVLVCNRAQSLRDANEKLFTAQFPQCCPPTLVAREADRLRAFLAQHKDVVIKPLGTMGGESIFRIRTGDPNTSTILEILTDNGKRFAMVQRYIPEISAGDKRILLIDGEPVPYALARVPAPGELRGNLAVGGQGVGVELSERDRWICAQVAPTLLAMGLTFVGLDVIGDYLTEINVTSPTCIRELDKIYGLDIGDQLMNAIERQLRQSTGGGAQL